MQTAPMRLEQRQKPARCRNGKDGVAQRKNSGRGWSTNGPPYPGGLRPDALPALWVEKKVMTLAQADVDPSLPSRWEGTSWENLDKRGRVLAQSERATAIRTHDLWEIERQAKQMREAGLVLHAGKRKGAQILSASPTTKCRIQVIDWSVTLSFQVVPRKGRLVLEETTNVAVWATDGVR